ncbi:TPM domain-containing protein [Acutalibacter sp. 1XD8-36]|uniref:TPM domain-containing protein n=1 Tax=Acutalibacter sp. 1XD8-36 TaxID=2320852 RepID=UPI0014121185|nr:TPM domain-containing protein [Acutalibacter sp. 1XD8-36]NBJ89241.1 TPM domain-containing protein [Acutalibacter sp. 1XD8-36]
MERSARLRFSKIFSLLFVTFLFLLSSLYCGAANTARAESGPAIPEPGADFYYSDGANVLSGETKSLILTKNAGLSSRSVQLVVLTMDTLPVTGYTQRVEYLRSVMKSWQVGGTEGRGLILALSISDEDYVAAAGDGLQSHFTTDLLKSMLDAQLEPDFAARAYDAGVSKFITEAAAEAEAFTDTPEGQPVLAEPEPEEEGKGLGALPLGLLISLPAAAVCIAFFAFRGRRRRYAPRRRVHRHSPLVTPPRTTVLHRESRTPMIVKSSQRSEGPSRIRKL